MKLLGSKKREIWQRLSQELGGAMHSSWRGDKVQVAHEDWVITLDTYVVMANNAPIFFTRIRAPFVNRSEFRFSVRRRGEDRLPTLKPLPITICIFETILHDPAARDFTLDKTLPVSDDLFRVIGVQGMKQRIFRRYFLLRIP